MSSVYKWYLPTVSEIITLAEPVVHRSFGSFAQQRVKAEAEWSSAVVALNQLLKQTLEVEQLAVESSEQQPQHGVLLSAPFPILLHPELASHMATWMFTVASPGETLQLLPAVQGTTSDWAKVATLPLLPDDPLAVEQFGLVLTTEFSLVMVLGETAEGEPAFLFSFEPEVVRQTWRALAARLKLVAPQRLADLTQVVEQFPLLAPDYRTVTQFSRLMLAHLPPLMELEGRSGSGSPTAPEIVSSIGQTVSSPRDAREHSDYNQRLPLQRTPTSREAAAKNATPSPCPAQANQTSRRTRKSSTDSATVPPSPIPPPDSHPLATNSLDAELLQAIAHEVRTPLTTIRTLTRLLLRRKDLKPDAIRQLEIIDRECTEQIDRFTLIFRAVELETTDARNLLTSLAPIPLERVLQQNAPRWQQQANQHNHTLDIILPQKMPLVVTDPAMLDQALTGLIDRITHSLPPGSHIQVKVSLAGHQLKLQLEAQPQQSDGADNHPFHFTPTLKSIGQLLMFQPETGNLSLNMAVTKNLFQALGGKLIVRHRPEQGEVLTIFLPLEIRKE